MSLSADTSDDALHVGWPSTSGGFVAVVDPEISGSQRAAPFLGEARAVYELVDRPTVSGARVIEDIISAARVEHIVSVGSGLAIDVAKLAVYGLHERHGQTLRHTAVPCGPEPYRSVTPFSMYDSEPGARGVAWEEWLRPADVAIVPELLNELDPAVAALFSGDSLVHAIESLLSTRSSAESERHAVAAARTFVDQAEAARLDRVQLVVASIQAALAFATTVLGLAHALSRPLGIAAGVSHDGYNLMLGAPVVRFWGTDTIASSPLARINPPEPTAEAWSGVIDRYRERAGLPARLADSELSWSACAAAIDWAPNSSGFPTLPGPVGEQDLERLMELAWTG